MASIYTVLSEGRDEESLAQLDEALGLVEEQEREEPEAPSHGSVGNRSHLAGMGELYAVA